IHLSVGSSRRAAYSTVLPSRKECMNPDKTFLPGAAKTFRLRPLLSAFAPLPFAATNSLRATVLIDNFFKD
ncbi:hypothetical protein, partial [Salmonella enterica]|uniref:hypothetical protein n=1 Tax=Salmonella enterica TaxID=28901 RepID=UPI001F41EC96